MTFELLPVLDLMEELYSQPITRKRFSKYLVQLQGKSKGDLQLPIMGFNPMAKEHVNAKLQELKQLKVEQLISEILYKLNQKLKKKPERIIQVALNLADDAKGGWTNRYTTDFDSKFKINAIVNRNFCTPYFWTSEQYNIELIKVRTLSYASRTIHWIKHGRLKTVEDHVQQELFVQKMISQFGLQVEEGTTVEMTPYYEQHKGDSNYSRIFNFFYGNEVCASLGYPEFMNNELT